MEDRYTIKYNLLLQKYLEIDAGNEKLQNRICHIRKQIRYLRKLKRLLIQKLVVYGDRFMDVCLEIPDMEPGANVEDQIIHRVAEIPHPTTPPQSLLASSSRSSVNIVVTDVLNSAIGLPSMASSTSPPKKRRRTTVTQEEAPSGIANPPTLGRSVSHQHRKPLVTPSLDASSSPSFLQSRGESIEAHQSARSSTASSSVPHYHHQVSASVEDVVNSVVFDCQQERRNRQANESVINEQSSTAPNSVAVAPVVSISQQPTFDFESAAIDTTIEVQELHNVGSEQDQIGSDAPNMG